MSEQASIVPEDKQLREALTDVKTKLATLIDWTKSRPSTGTEGFIKYGETFLHVVQTSLASTDLRAKSLTNLSALLVEKTNPEELSMMGGPVQTADEEIKFAASTEVAPSDQTRAALEEKVNQLRASVKRFDNVVKSFVPTYQGKYKFHSHALG